MKEGLKTGIIHTSYGAHGYPTAFSLIAEHGYDCVDYQSFVNIESDFFKLPLPEFEKELIHQKALIEGYGLTVSQAHAPWRTPKDGDPEERKLWREAMKKAIYGTSVLGCHRFIVHTLLPYMDGPDHPEEVWALNEDFIADLADYASKYDIKVCVENLPFPLYPLSTVEAVCELVDKLKRDNLKVCLDTGHAAIFKKERVGDAVRYIGTRLEAVHIHDNMGDTDSHMIPGEGIIDWEDFATALSEIGFDKVISLETGTDYDLYQECEWDERERALADFAKDLAKKAAK